MEKPLIIPANPLDKIFVQKYERYLPTAYDESMSILEKVNKVIIFLNQMSELTNDTVDQWNTVMDWVLNDGLDSSVIAKFDEMIEDGSLDNIINNEILLGKPDIVISPSQPANPNLNTFWYKEV